MNPTTSRPEIPLDAAVSAVAHQLKPCLLLVFRRFHVQSTRGLGTMRSAGGVVGIDTTDLVSIGALPSGLEKKNIHDILGHVQHGTVWQGQPQRSPGLSQCVDLGVRKGISIATCGEGERRRTQLLPSTPGSQQDGLWSPPPSRVSDVECERSGSWHVPVAIAIFESGRPSATGRRGGDRQIAHGTGDMHGSG